MTHSVFTTGLGGLLAGSDPLSHVLPHKLIEDDIFGLSFTNHVFMLLVSMVLLLIFIPLAAKKPGIVPSGFRNFLEAMMQFIREGVARPVLGSATDQFIPFLWTFFFTILTANLLGMIPLGAMLAAGAGFDATLQHWGGTATGNLSVTAGLAICGFFLIHFGGMAKQGAGTYWKNYFFGHAPIALSPLMIPLEIISGLVKPFALSVRLFANMVAGHIVLAVLLGFAVAGAVAGGAMYGVTIVSVLGCAAFSLLELFVAFLQAYIFTFLLTLFIGAAIHSDHEDRGAAPRLSHQPREGASVAIPVGEPDWLSCRSSARFRSPRSRSTSSARPSAPASSRSARPAVSAPSARRPSSRSPVSPKRVARSRPP